MKGITKHHETLRMTYTPISQYWPRVSYVYDVIAAFKLSCKMSHIDNALQKISRIYPRSYHFTLRHYFLYPPATYIDS